MAATRVTGSTLQHRGFSFYLRLEWKYVFLTFVFVRSLDKFCDLSRWKKKIADQSDLLVENTGNQSVFNLDTIANSQIISKPWWSDVSIYICISSFLIEILDSKSRKKVIPSIHYTIISQRKELSMCFENMLVLNLTSSVKGSVDGGSHFLNGQILV